MKKIILNLACLLITTHMLAQTAEVGPGGVVDGLRMWLDANDPSSLVLNPDGRVLSWKDKTGISNTIYSADIPTETTMKVTTPPKYINSAFFTNYYPSLYFDLEANNGSNRQYLGTLNGPGSLASPDGYTFIHVIYYDKPFKDRSYFLSFINTGGSFAWGNPSRRPVFGMRNTGKVVSGRYYEAGATSYEDTKANLFNMNEGAIAFDILDKVNTTIRMEANGRYESTTKASRLGSHTFLNEKSMLGAGSYNNAQFRGYMAQSIYYERVLTDAEKTKIYSSLAIKYGITLRIPQDPNISQTPEEQANNKFNYILSNNESIYDGYSSPYENYFNEVSGLVRDDDAGLYNNIARPGDTDAPITLLADKWDFSQGQGTKSILKNNLSSFFIGNNGADGVTVFTEQQLKENCGTSSMKSNIVFLAKKTNFNETVQFVINNTLSPTFPYAGRGYQLSLLVANSPEKLESNKWDYVIPMVYVENKNGITGHYAAVNFPDNITYFTIGVRGTGGDCGDCGFQGYKSIEFTKKNWTRGSKQNTFDMGEGFIADISTYFVDSNNQQGTWYNKNYPRVGNHKTLAESRRNSLRPKMTTKISLSNPSKVQFSLYGLSRQGNRYKNLSIYALCTDTVYPFLTYANVTKNSFTLLGNTTQSKYKPTSGYNSQVGMLNVEFDVAVSDLYIEEYGSGVESGSQKIGIGPLSFVCPVALPPFNEAGLSFIKQATDTVVMCGESSLIDYSFYIYNSNCDEKIITLRDTLPQNLSWDTDLLNITPGSFIPETSINISSDGRILTLKNIVVAGASNPYLITAQAKTSPATIPGEYKNRAWIEATMIKNDVDTLVVQGSGDYALGEDQPSVTILKSGGENLKFLTITSKTESCYNASDELEVELTLVNPNTIQIPDIYFEVNYNKEFSYKSGSFSSSIPLIQANPSFFTNGETDEILDGAFYLESFNIPPGTYTVKFTLDTPNEKSLVGLVNSQGQPIDNDGNVLTGNYNPSLQAKADLEVAYDMSSNTDDACINTISNIMNNFNTPYCNYKTSIITNKNITEKF